MLSCCIVTSSVSERGDTESKNDSVVIQKIRSYSIKSKNLKQKDDRQRAIRIAHLSFQLRWAKNQIILYKIYHIGIKTWVIDGYIIKDDVIMYEFIIHTLKWPRWWRDHSFYQCPIKIQFVLTLTVLGPPGPDPKHKLCRSDFPRPAPKNKTIIFQLL
jgi:hypothetical protein